MITMTQLNRKYPERMSLSQTQLTNNYIKHSAFKHIKELLNSCNYFAKIVIQKEKNLCRTSKNRKKYNLAAKSLRLWPLQV